MSAFAAVVAPQSARPVPLYHYLVGKQGSVYKEGRSWWRDLAMPVPPPAETIYWRVAALCKEAMEEGKDSVLVFCATKRRTYDLAGALPECLGVPALGPKAAELCASSVERLKATGPRNMGEQLEEAVARGVAFHTGEVSRDQRKIVEEAYHGGAVRILVSTRTVSTGANLPARRVVIMDGWTARPSREHWLTHLDYLQIAGRAGRKGYDDLGEAFLLEQQGIGPGFKDCQAIISGQQSGHTTHAAARSRLIGNLNAPNPALQHAVLQGLFGGAGTMDGLRRWMASFLVAQQKGKDWLNTAVAKALHAISSLEAQHHIGSTGGAGAASAAPLVGWDEEGQRFQLTPLGVAVAACGMQPREAMAMRDELVKARRHMVLCSDLHFCFLCVDTLRWPDFTKGWGIQQQGQWRRLAQKLEELWELGRDDDRCAAEAILGAGPQAYHYARNKASSGRYFGQERDVLYRRMQAAMVLWELINGMSAEEVTRAFEEDSSRHADRAAAFCERMGPAGPGWQELAAMLKCYQKRIWLREKREVVNLGDSLGERYRVEARLLFNAGMRSASDVAAAPLSALVAALATAPRHRGKNREQMLSIWRARARRIQKRAQEEVARQGGGPPLDAGSPARVAAAPARHGRGVRVPGGGVRRRGSHSRAAQHQGTQRGSRRKARRRRRTATTRARGRTSGAARQRAQMARRRARAPSPATSPSLSSRMQRARVGLRS